MSTVHAASVSRPAVRIDYGTAIENFSGVAFAGIAEKLINHSIRTLKKSKKEIFD